MQGPDLLLEMRVCADANKQKRPPPPSFIHLKRLPPTLIWFICPYSGYKKEKSRGDFEWNQEPKKLGKSQCRANN